MARKIKLSETTAAKLDAIDGQQTVYWDERLTGFGVRVSPGRSGEDGERNPTRTFFVQGRLGGKLLKVTIGRLGRIKCAKARSEAERIVSMLELGQDPRAKKHETADETTFGVLMTAYVEYLELQGKLSARAVKNQITRDIEEAFPRLWEKSASEIDIDDCMKIIGRVKDAGSPRQADKLRSYIRTAFSEAINARGDVNMPASMRGLNIKSNPARDMRKVSGSGGAKDRALTLSELRAYWSRINKLAEPHRSIAILHVLTGGQRQVQLARVKLTDIDRDAPSMTLWDPKGRRASPYRHVVPLLPEALDAIDRITGGGDYVFSANGGQSAMHDSFIGEITKRICSEMEKAGELEKGPFTAGAIRAAVETRLAAQPYRVSSDVLGHLLSHGRGGVQNRHYQRHDFFDEKLEALEMLRRMVEGTSEPSAQIISMRARA